MKQQTQWRKLNGTRINRSIAEEIKEMLMQEKTAGHNISVCIGTDSQVKSGITEFATVIVFIRKGKGGFMYINNDICQRTIPVKQRMLEEVQRSIDVAYKLCDVITAFNVAMEVHVDINTDPRFKSNEAFRDAMGYITGMGFTFRAKPNAFASSCCANKVVQ
jgi:predicted RNase H-related nuclease YkuK (DUF458 family)